MAAVISCSVRVRSAPRNTKAKATDFMSAPRAALRYTSKSFTSSRIAPAALAMSAISGPTEVLSAITRDRSRLTAG